MARHRSRDDLDVMIEALEHQGGDLSKWEEGFLQSMREQFDAGKALTERQLEVLERLYAKWS